MRYFIVLALSSFLVACGGGDEQGGSGEGTTSDTTSNGIVEYELNSDRLSAVDYNNQLSLIQQSVYDQIGVLFLSSPEFVDQNLDNTLFELELKATDLKNIETLAGGEAFKAAVLALIEFYKTELKGEFLEVLPILKLEAEERTQAQVFRLNDYDEQFAIQEKPLLENIVAEQEKFAVNNNFKVE